MSITVTDHGVTSWIGWPTDSAFCRAQYWDLLNNNYKNRKTILKTEYDEDFAALPIYGDTQETIVGEDQGGTHARDLVKTFLTDGRPSITTLSNDPHWCSGAGSPLPPADTDGDPDIISGPDGWNVLVPKLKTAINRLRYTGSGYLLGGSASGWGGFSFGADGAGVSAYFSSEKVRSVSSVMSSVTTEPIENTSHLAYTSTPPPPWNPFMWEVGGSGLPSVKTLSETSHVEISGKVYSGVNQIQLCLDYPLHYYNLTYAGTPVFQGAIYTCTVTVVGPGVQYEKSFTRSNTEHSLVHPDIAGRGFITVDIPIQIGDINNAYSVITSVELVADSLEYYCGPYDHFGYHPFMHGPFAFYNKSGRIRVTRDDDTSEDIVIQYSL